MPRINGNDIGESTPPIHIPGHHMPLTMNWHHGDTPVFTLLPRRPPHRLGLASSLAGRDDAVEAAADRVQKRVVADRAADQLAPPQRGEGRSSASRVEKDRRSAARGR